MVHHRFRGRCAREEREVEVGEDKIFCGLGGGGIDVFCCALSPLRLGVVGVMLEGGSAKQERDDAGPFESK